MIESGTDSATITWSVPECPFTIEASTRVLDDIRLAVMDAFFSLPRGGAEIGGILLGTFETGLLVIGEHAPLDCEHANGPGFTLSSPDEARLKELLAAHAHDSNGLRPVGWYHSHTRSEIFLSDADLEIHRRFFPEPWQIGLVMKPHTFEPARIGFFFRETDGSVRAAASYREETLDALPIHQMPSPVPTAPPQGPPLRRFRPNPIPPIVPEPAAGSPAAAAPLEPSRPGLSWPVLSQPDVGQDEPLHPEPAHLVSAQPELAQPEPAQYAPAQLVTSQPKTSPSETSRDAAAQLESPVEIPAPRFLVESPSHSRRWVAGIVLGVGLGAMAAGFQTRQVWLPRVISAMRTAPPAPALGLTTIDREGQLQINWDRNSPAVRRAPGAMLEISDGGPLPVSIPLDNAHLQAGSFTYARQAEKVDVKLIVRQANGPDFREVASFLGKLPERRSPEENPEIQKQRDEMAVQAAKTKKLEKDVETMRQELRQQRQRRLTNQAPDR